MVERSFKQILADRLEKTTMVTKLANQTRIPLHYVSADAVAAPFGAWISQQWKIAGFFVILYIQEE